jgi:hypothetical protein
VKGGYGWAWYLLAWGLWELFSMVYCLRLSVGAANRLESTLRPHLTQEG